MDGLLSRVLYDLLIDLGRNGLSVGRCRVKLMLRPGTNSTSTSYENGAALLDAVRFVELPRYLCQVGGYPVISNIELKTVSPAGYTVSVYDVIGSRRITSVSPMDRKRDASIASVEARYLQYVAQRMEQYAADVSKSMEARTSAYVDPCYVDAGYVV